MSAALALTAKLAAPFANMLFKKWLETENGQALAEGLVDIFKEILPGVRGSERVSRQFQMLGSAIANKLDPIVAGITTRKSAIALVDHLEDLLPVLAKDPRTLFHISIATTDIVERWKRQDGNWLTVNRWQPTSQVGKAYDAALHLIAVEFKANLNALPDWQGDATIAILERLDTLVAESVRGKPDHRQFEEEYRHHLADKCRYLKLFGLPTPTKKVTDLRHHSDMELDKAYVTLSLGGSGSVDNVGIVLDHRSQQGKLRLLVLGEAGCGKTTMLQWVARRCAERRLEPIARVPHRDTIGKPTSLDREQTKTLMDWRLRVPFLIRLREHVDKPDFPPFEEWTKPEGPLGTPPVDWARQVLLEGRALVLVDGLDEYPEDKRLDLLRSLKKFLDLHHDNACIVTSRGAAVPRQWQDACPMEYINVLEITPNNRRALIHAWFKALPDYVRHDSGCAIDEYPEQLIAEIESRPTLSQIAGNPLLCSMLCALKLANAAELPDDITAVCRDFVEMLLLRRDKDRRMPDEVAPDYYVLLKHEDREAIASELAYAMVIRNRSEVDTDTAIEMIADTIDSLSPAAESLRQEPKRAIAAMLERSGLLQSPEKGKLQFIHNSLKEYLAAVRLADRDDIGYVVRNLPGSPWNNIAIFMAGLRRDRVTGALVEKMLARVQRGGTPPERWGSVKREMALLIIAIATKRGGVSSETRQKIKDTCHPCLPPRTAREADLLAQLSESALPLLPAIVPDHVNQAAACARCLRLIGTPTAKKILADHYSAISENEVAFEVAQSLEPAHCSGLWNWLVNRELFDFTEFPEELTSRIQKLPIIEKNEQQITKLNISGLSYLSDINNIIEHAKLTSINLVNTAVSNISVLKNLKLLRDIHLNNTAISDISDLNELRNLQILELNNTAVSKIFALKNLQNLQYLFLSNTAVSDLSALKELQNLEYLSLNYTAVSDLSALKGLQNLRYLHLANTAVSDISVLKDIQTLDNLDLSNTAVSDVSDLKNLQNLQILDLSNTAVSDVSDLKNLRYLRHLDLSNTAVKDVGVLKKKMGLTIIGP